MDVPQWKKWLSYLYPINLETVTSQYQRLEVNLQYGQTVLDSAQANYSFGNLHIVFQSALEKVPIPNYTDASILILGFGAGSIASILKNDYGYQGKLVGVEIDQEVISLGKRYFDFDQWDEVEINIQSAKQFLKLSSETYDMILVDVFVDAQVPEELLGESFLNDCLEHLNLEGQLLMNTMNQSTTDRLKSNWSTVFAPHGKIHEWPISKDNTVLGFQKLA